MSHKVPRQLLGGEHLVSTSFANSSLSLSARLSVNHGPYLRTSRKSIFLKNSLVSIMYSLYASPYIAFDRYNSLPSCAIKIALRAKSVSLPLTETGQCVRVHKILLSKKSRLERYIGTVFDVSCWCVSTKPVGQRHVVHDGAFGIFARVVDDDPEFALLKKGCERLELNHSADSIPDCVGLLWDSNEPATPMVIATCRLV